MLRRKQGLPLFCLARRSTHSRAMNVLERIPLTAQHSLHLVRIGERTLVIATCPTGVVFDPQNVPFSDMFRQTLAAPEESVRIEVKS